MAGRRMGAAFAVSVVLLISASAGLCQSFRVQCPTSTITHPDPTNQGLYNTEPEYKQPTYVPASPSNPATYTSGFTGVINGAIKCQQISGGDGYASMGDGTQTYLFSFGPLSGLADISKGKPGTQFPNVFNDPYPGTGASNAANPKYLSPGDPDTTDGGAPGLNTFGYNGAIGLVPDLDAKGAGQCDAPGMPSCVNGHVDPRQIMDVGVMNGNIPAPLMAIDEDDEFFLTLTNVGMIMRPDLFEQHTVHFHGYPNASSFYDGVPDASVAINIGGSFTYYYLAPDAGTYFYHCHITPPEHLQMGMVGQLFVRPRQDRWTGTGDLFAGLQAQQTDLRTKCDPSTDILCTNPLPKVHTAENNKATIPNGGTSGYAYNDGDGSTYYDAEFPLQIHGFDPNFHFVGMTFNPEGFADMKDKYFLLNGRSYPDTVNPDPLDTQAADSVKHFSQPLSAIVTIKAGQRALLRISDLDVAEYQTLASLSIPMQVIGYNAKLLRDQAGNNMYYNTNSITLGGGESLDVILDTCLDAQPRTSLTSCTKGMDPGTYFLYTPNLDHLANDAENFGGLMTEIHVTN